MSAAKRVGGDWVENTDPNSGRIYYANLVTREVSWEMPEEVKKLQDGASTPSSPSPSPSASKSTESKPQTIAVFGPWREVLDPKSGRKYYFNKETKETSWSKPEGFDEGATPVTQPTESQSKDLPADWVSQVDKKSGRTYFYNKSTKETSWKHPVTGEVSPKPESEVKAEAEAEAKPIKAVEAKPEKEEKKEEKAEKKEGEDKFARLRAFKKEREKKEEESKSKAKEAKNSNVTSTTQKMAELVKETVETMRLEDYAATHFNFNRKGMFKRETTMDKILTFKKDLIRTSLLSLNPDLVPEAIQAFRNITGYMGDRPSKKDNMGHANKLLKYGLKAPEILRDEIYCQLCKQTSSNPSDESTVKGWELLSLCAGCYPPSQEFLPYFLSFCQDHKSVEGRVGQLASYVMDRVQRCAILGPRREVPTDAEVSSVKDMRSTIIRVHLLNGRALKMMVESWTTAADLAERVSRRLGIHDNRPFAIFEVNESEEERALEGEERILDVLSFWQREFSSVGKRNASQYRFVYKVTLYLDPASNDRQALSMFYIQAWYDVHSERYPVHENDAISIAALCLQHDFGDYQGDVSIMDENLLRYLPHSHSKISGGANQQLQQSVVERYNQLAGTTPEDCKRQLLDIVKQLDMYGSSYFFDVQPMPRGDLPESVVVAVNPRGVMILDPETKNVAKDFRYQELVTWGHASNSFVLAHGTLMQQKKYFLKTDQGKEVNYLVNMYVQMMVEAQATGL